MASIILLGDLSEFDFKYHVYSANNIDDAIDYYEKKIENSCYYNIIFSKYKLKEDGFKLLKQFVEFNKRKDIYPFFLFLENDNFNKKILYSYFLENINNIKGLKDYCNFSSHNILFCKNKKKSILEVIETKIISYFYQESFKINSNIKYDLGINCLVM